MNRTHILWVALATSLCMNVILWMDREYWRECAIKELDSHIRTIERGTEQIKLLGSHRQVP